jgi:hypothetical protein
MSSNSFVVGTRPIPWAKETLVGLVVEKQDEKYKIACWRVMRKDADSVDVPITEAPLETYVLDAIAKYLNYVALSQLPPEVYMTDPESRSLPDNVVYMSNFRKKNNLIPLTPFEMRERIEEIKVKIIRDREEHNQRIMKSYGIKV